MNGSQANEHPLKKLLDHWRALVQEAYSQGEEGSQSALLRGHAYGVGDGLQLAIEQLIAVQPELDDTEAEEEDTRSS